jgi:hypothetical protein
MTLILASTASALLAHAALPNSTACSLELAEDGVEHPVRHREHREEPTCESIEITLFRSMPTKYARSKTAGNGECRPPISAQMLVRKWYSGCCFCEITTCETTNQRLAHTPQHRISSSKTCTGHSLAMSRPLARRRNAPSSEKSGRKIWLRESSRCPRAQPMRRCSGRW